MNIHIKQQPTVGFITRTNRKIYGHDNYNRDYKIVMGTTALLVTAGLFLAIMGVL